MASGQPVQDEILTPAGYEQVTSLSSAAALTVPTDARWALIQAETQNVRYRDDGQNPTASVGMVIAAGGSLWYNGSLSSLRFVEATATAKLNVVYYK